MTTPTTGERIITLIKTIILARHGKAVKINPTDLDGARQLNELGLQQAIKLGRKLEPYAFDLVLSSPLPRARITMAIATCGHYTVHDVPELTCDTGPGSPIETMWTELRNVPIAKYFEHRLAGDLRSWAVTALDAMLRSIELLAHGSGRTVLVGGHALLQPILTCAITDALHESGMRGTAQASNMAATEILNEGEAFVLSLDRLCGNNRVLAEHLTLD